MSHRSITGTSFDGTITNTIVYPLTRALYGKMIRQPIGGDFGFSGRLTKYYLKQDVWRTDVARQGINIWMTTEALANNFKVAQAFLGAKIHDPGGQASDLSEMLAQIMSAVFGQIEMYGNVWKQIHRPDPVPTFGFRSTVRLEPVHADIAGMLVIFREGVKSLRTIWSEVLGWGDLTEVERVGAAADRDLVFPNSLWTRIIYDYAVAYRQRIFPRKQLLKSLTPLYLGKAASFIRSVEKLGQEETETEIEKLCLEFEKNKDHLIKIWR